MFSNIAGRVLNLLNAVRNSRPLHLHETSDYIITKLSH
jgi:hypothetical protein